VKPRTVLLVEDNADDALLMQRAFRMAGFESPIQVVTDGQKAIDYLSGDGLYTDREKYPLPRLMLLDLKMPCKSGLEVLTWARERAELKRLVVVVLTSSNQSIDIYWAYELGANSYLVKPVSFQNLLEMVTTLKLYWLKLNRQGGSFEPGENEP